MKNFSSVGCKQAIRVGVICAAWHSGAALAANGGCFHVADGYYQIGQTAQMEVHNGIPENQIVRESKAVGDGNILAQCLPGLARFEGRYTVATQGNLVPLTVGGRPSGFGIELFIKELKEQTEYGFPHLYERTFTSVNNPIYSSAAEVGYRVRRMTGPIAFGRVDPGTIGEQWAYQINGVRTQPFRHMVIYELSFVRPGCSIEVGDLNQTVKLGSYHVGNFATPDRATPWVPFQLTVKECQEFVGMVASFTFGTGADADSDDPTLFSLSGPQNVGLELSDEDYKTIAPGKTASFNALATGKDYVFNVRMRETKPTVRGGVFSRPVRVTVNFM